MPTSRAPCKRRRSDDGVDVLDVFLERVRVVEAQVADAAALLRDAEVQADALGMADVEVAAGLGAKSGVTTRWCLPTRRSSATMSRMKSDGAGAAPGTFAWSAMQASTWRTGVGIATSGRLRGTSRVS